MNHIERIDAVMNHQPVDRTPFAFVDAGAWVSKTENKSYDELYHLSDAGASIFTGHLNDIGTDLVSGVNGVFTAWLSAFGCSIDTTKIGNPVNTKPCFTSPEQLDHLDKSDIREKLLADDFVQCMLRQCEETKKIVGDDKYVIVDIAGPYTVANVMYGTAEYLMLLMKDKDRALELLDYATEASLDIFRLLREHGADISFIAEPCASGNMLSPKMMKEYVLPEYKTITETLDYKYYIAHICGKSGNRVKDLASTDINAFSCDYMVDLDEAFNDCEGKKLILFGNVNPAGVIWNGTPEETYAEACAAIKKANGRSLILATGCDLASGAPLENIMMLPKACEDLA